MHKYLRSIGFRKLNKEGLKNLVIDIAANPDVENFIYDREGNQYVELRREVAHGTGIALRGTFDENDAFLLDYYYPYLEGTVVSTNRPVELVKQSDKDSYQGLCDDSRLGVDLIFYIQDMIELIRGGHQDEEIVDFGGVRLSGLATEGKIILPMVSNSPKMQEQEDKCKKRHIELTTAAREGDPEALERLTLVDMDTYSMISRRLETEDILSIVRSTFMPNGIECDKYYIVGEIVGYRNIVNKLSMELVHILTLNCNDIIFDLAINGTDLMGEPEIGRRFKGKIWLQGIVIE